LQKVAQILMDEGARPAGTVQVNTEISQTDLCDMDVRILPAGPVIRISQSLGSNAQGCRLDPDALEQAVAQTRAVLERGADCLIVNKFGKHEADGRGFRDVIVAALEQGLPVLTGLNKHNIAAFEAFTGGAAVALPPDAEKLVQWMRDALQVQ
jgi:hypothetical protein